ncbi:PEPxxWA-CTERM sorting domain-containing protein [Sphingobium subterraneum]|uniref:Ice-binding protein C-terminal domain-containing protein n=1 Tax=Sphingobium subterraneum TaxID=627688 RepID=A0A841IWU8_9SPHN|nr:PEPxxWA-CTERM sorting domain-containing protein [Sphingobium subterraneum]MBB6122622.1 hypothetical protein [Sphingobium subterraneum]
MKKAILGIGGLVAALTASTAHAAVVFTFNAGVAASTLLGAGFVVQNDFDGSAGVGGSGFQFLTGSSTSGSAIPTSGTDTTPYLSVLGGGEAIIDLPNVEALAFDWGTLDTYNTLTVFGYDGGGAFSTSFTPLALFSNPGDLAPADGQTSGAFALLGTAGERFSRIVLTSSTNSFEIDNLLVKGAIPEPSTWAMMIVGLGMVGYAMRSRQRTKVSFA